MANRICEMRETRFDTDQSWAGRRASFTDCREDALLERWLAQFWMTWPLYTTASVPRFFIAAAELARAR